MKVTQRFQSGVDQVAGRDIHNTNIHIREYKHWMATLSSQELHARALDNEYFFAWRYGFAVSEQERQRVIDLQRHFGLSDARMRYYRRHGVLRVRRGCAVLVPSVTIEAVGWVYAAVLVTVAFLLGVVATAATLLANLALLALVIVAGGIVWSWILPSSRARQELRDAAESSA